MTSHLIKMASIKKSCKNIWNSLRISRLQRSIERSISWNEFDSIRDWYFSRDIPAIPQEQKYFDKDFQLKRNIAFAIRLGLHKGKAKKVLDIGSGMGWFALVCHHLGHEVIGLDCENELYQKTFNLWQIPRIEHWINQYQPMPIPQDKYNLVTAFSVCFNGHEAEQLWKKEEWGYWLDDVSQNMQVGGKMFLAINKEPDGTYLSEELKQYFLNMGAILEGRYISLTHNANCQYIDTETSVLQVK